MTYTVQRQAGVEVLAFLVGLDLVTALDVFALDLDQGILEGPPSSPLTSPAMEDV